MSEADEDTVMDLTNPDVVTKHKLAGEMASRVLVKVMGLCAPGASVRAICGEGDAAIVAETGTVYNKKVEGKPVEKGVAFPTCISVNHTICHFSPLLSDPDVELAEGDVVKIDLGVHLDGFISVCAHTFVLGASKDAPVTGRKADVILAAHYAAEAAIRMAKSGNKTDDVTKAIAKIAEDFQCTPVEGMLSHQVLRNKIDGEKAIIQNPTEQQRKEHKESKFETNEVYGIDIIMSTGDGKAKQGEERTTVYKKTDEVYQLKMKASRTFYSEVCKNFTSMPFSLRACSDEKTARLGVTECVKHSVVSPFPVLHEKEGEYVAQAKITVLLMANGNMRATTSPMELDSIKSDHEVSDPEIKKLLLTSVTTKSKKKNKKKKKAGAKAAEPGEAGAAAAAAE